MNAPEDLPPDGAVGKRDLAARMAEVKQKAARGPSVAAAEDFDEEALLAQAAFGVAGRREARGDLVGAMAWEEIAGGAVVPAESPGADLPGTEHLAPGDHQTQVSYPGQVVPARQTRQDGHDDH